MTEICICHTEASVHISRAVHIIVLRSFYEHRAIQIRGGAWESQRSWYIDPPTGSETYRTARP